MAARLERSAAGCCVCQRPVSWLSPYKHRGAHQTCCNTLFLADPHHPCLLLTHYSPPSVSLSVSLSISGTSQLSSVTQASGTEPGPVTRLQGVAFPGEKDKQEWEREQEEARRRDHRRIGTVGEENKASQKETSPRPKSHVCLLRSRTRSCSSSTT